MMLALTVIKHEFSTRLKANLKDPMGLFLELIFNQKKKKNKGHWWPMQFVWCIQRATATLQILHTGPFCSADTQRWDKPPWGEECTTLQPVLPYWCGIMFFSSGGKKHLENFLDQSNLTEACTPHFLGAVLWLPHWLLSSTSLLRDVILKSESP